MEVEELSKDAEILINMNFTHPDGSVVRVREFTVHNTGPYNLNEVHPSAVESNTSFEYSGRHDHGQLPTLKSTGPLSDLIKSIYDAKKISDEYLTALIDVTAGASKKSTKGLEDGELQIEEYDEVAETEEIAEDEDSDKQQGSKRMRLSEKC